jgi:hypothetical protein
MRAAPYATIARTVGRAHNRKQCRYEFGADACSGKLPE